ncbi:MAG TPA: hypothetical protein PK264_23440, partial [Hyphomicrobiaceae bacterium]|nr:hypothetical protein [Hyphomicrobiaceae bacterium]
MQSAGITSLLARGRVMPEACCACRQPRTTRNQQRSIISWLRTRRSHAPSDNPEQILGARPFRESGKDRLEALVDQQHR